MPFLLQFSEILISQASARLWLRRMLSSFGEACDVDGVQEEGQLAGCSMFHMNGACEKALD